MSDESVAARVIDTLKIAGVSSLATGGTNTTYGRSFPMPREATFAWVFQFDSPGVVNVKIELEQSDVRPATEGAADANYVIPDGGGVISSAITDEVVHRVAYAPKVSGYGRFKFTGLNSGTTNDAGTVVTKAQCTYVR